MRVFTDVLRMKPTLNYNEEMETRIYVYFG